MKLIHDNICPNCNDDLATYTPIFSDDLKEVEFEIDCPSCDFTITVKADVTFMEERYS
jgi:hypothetical protein